MAGLASLGEQVALNAILASATISLHTSDPGDSGGSEVSEPSYSRAAASFTLTGNNPTVGSNSAIVTFNPAASPWGTITYFGLWSAGTFMGSGVLSSPKDVNTGDTPRFQAGALTVAIN